MRPMQPLFLDGEVVRFQANKIVTAVLEQSRLDLNMIARMNFSQEDREQFAQLIGYSVSGFGELSYVSDSTYALAEEAADQMKTDVCCMDAAKSDFGDKKVGET